MMKNKDRGVEIGLALGGGAARGWAHVGVLQGLRERDIEVGCLTGTSIGALVGAFFATGKLSVLENMAEDFGRLKALRFFDLAWARDGFVSGRRVSRFMNQHFKGIAIEDLPLPFAVATVDLRTGERVILQRGDLARAVRASISIPGLFPPVQDGGRMLVDGGLADPLPVGLTRSLGAKTVIGVDLNWHIGAFANGRGNGRRGDDSISRGATVSRHWPRVRAKHKLGLFKITHSSLLVMLRQLTEARLRFEPCDLLIRPSLESISTFDFHLPKAGLEAGYQAALAALDQRPVMPQPAPEFPRGKP